MTEHPIGLVLTGGGAHAAYQAGVLDGIREILQSHGWPAERNPFPIICGTSAGALNGAALASHSNDWTESVRAIAAMWSEVHAGAVFRADPIGALGNAVRWLVAASLGWLVASPPRSLLDNNPLSDLLSRLYDVQRLQQCIDRNQLRAFAVTASSYTSGMHVTWFQGCAGIAPWQRRRRFAEPARIGIAHLMASSAIPFVFPAVPLEAGGLHEYFGDGSVRQTAPLSPAIHLGAARLVAIGAGAQPAITLPVQGGARPQDSYPTLAQIASQTMAATFLDGLDMDVDRLHRINQILSQVPGARRQSIGLRQIPILCFQPSLPLDQIATEHVKALPGAIRALLGVIGATTHRGAGLASYMLFEPAYTGRLVDLGRTDASARRDEILHFFSSTDPCAPDCALSEAAPPAA